MPTEFTSEDFPARLRGRLYEKRTAALALTGILLTVVYVVSLLARWSEPRMLPVGEPIPDFALSSGSGTKMNSANICGDRAVLLFFTRDCIHCRAMIRRLREVNDALSATVRVLYISLDTPSGTVNESGGDWGGSGLMFLDRADARRLLNIEAVPVMLFLDKKGMVLGQIVGERQAGELRKSLAEAFPDVHDR